MNILKMLSCMHGRSKVVNFFFQEEELDGEFKPKTHKKVKKASKKAKTSKATEKGSKKVSASTSRKKRDADVSTELLSLLSWW